MRRTDSREPVDDQYDTTFAVGCDPAVQPIGSRVTTRARASIITLNAPMTCRPRSPSARGRPSSSSSLARRRSRSTTRDLVKVLAIDVAEVFEGPRGPSGEPVKSLLVPDEKYRAFLEHATPDVERHLLEDGDVEVDIPQVLEPLVTGGESGRWGSREDQAHVEIGAGRRLSPRSASEEDHSQDIRIA